MSTQQISTSKGILRFGNKTQILDNELCKKIRTRLKVTRRQLSNAQIAKVINLSNIEIGNWLLENVEGFNIFKNMGTLAASKYTPLVLKNDVEEGIKKIEESNLPEFLKKRIIKKYNRQQRYSNLDNYNSYARIMWFNKKNCASRKAHVYRLEVAKSLVNKLTKKLKEGKQYERYKFQDFYKKRTHQEI